ncbi:hypothetical protein N5F00_19450 [Pseudomonas chengduensis]|nr:hypothetical protein [Pseudomonas chengduensis]MDH1731675.1 hypothetical protein [Pseudomonas chengduensis]
MDKNQLVWDHFKFNAEQRLKGFNFFVLLSIFADGGVFAALEKGLNPKLLILLGLFVILLSIVFWLVDSRSRQLINLTIPALKEMESSFPSNFKLFAIDAAHQGSIIRYTFAIRALLVAQLLFGLGIVLYGYCPW